MHACEDSFTDEVEWIRSETKAFVTEILVEEIMAEVILDVCRTVVREILVEEIMAEVILDVCRTVAVVVRERDVKAIIHQERMALLLLKVALARRERLHENMVCEESLNSRPLTTVFRKGDLSSLENSTEEIVSWAVREVVSGPRHSGDGLGRIITR